MNKFQRSWQLFKSSLVVMQRDKRLLLFPILTTAFSIIVVVLFLLPVAFQPTGHGYGTAEHWTTVGHSIYRTSSAQGANQVEMENVGGQGSGRNLQVQANGLRPLAVGYFAAIYFVSMFCATFCNVAFYKEIMNALAGEPVSILGGLRFAASKWKIILMWTLFAGAVGYLIKALEERFGFIGQMVMRFLGAAWSIACVFVIPVIITEEETSNPLTVLKKSALTLKQTWGESLIGYAGVSFGGLLVFLLSLGWLGTGIAMAVMLHTYWLIAVMALAWLLTLLVWGYMLSVASQIFRCALFVYASQGTLPQPYTQEMVALAWKARKH